MLIPEMMHNRKTKENNIQLQIPGRATMEFTNKHQLKLTDHNSGERNIFIRDNSDEGPSEKPQESFRLPELPK